jgi:hypothetical protein
MTREVRRSSVTVQHLRAAVTSEADVDNLEVRNDREELSVA